MRAFEWWRNKWDQWISAILLRLLSDHAMQGIVWKHRELLAAFVEKNRLTQPLISGSKARVHVDGTAVINNATLNALGGEIFIGPQVFLGHEVCLLTGTHDIHKVNAERKESGGGIGRDIVIKNGAWLASRVIVIGPATIGEHAVVGAGSVVLGDVEPRALYAGVPAKKVKNIELP
jgi:acetyltransferase-like isoleucine patch superfamily enzyme